MKVPKAAVLVVLPCWTSSCLAFYQLPYLPRSKNCFQVHFKTGYGERNLRRNDNRITTRIPRLRSPSSRYISLPLTSADQDVAVSYYDNDDFSEEPGTTFSWLEQATSDFLDESRIPKGQMTSDDLHGVCGLMSAWGKRGSTASALMVEQLLKRVIDELRVGNRAVHVNTKMYSMAIHAWAVSGMKGAAARAQDIHDAMVNMYHMSGDESVAPTTISYNAVINAWSKSKQNKSAISAEAILRYMVQEYKSTGSERIKPDAVTFTTVIDAYARSPGDNVDKADEILELMRSCDVKPNTYTFSAYILAVSRSSDPNKAQKAEQVLRNMTQQHLDGKTDMKPNVVNYNTVLNAYAHAQTLEAAERALSLLKRMKLDVNEGGEDVEPDRLSYALCISAWVRLNKDYEVMDTVENLIEAMEKRALEIDNPSIFNLEKESYNTAVISMQKSRLEDAPERAESIIKRMHKLAEQGFDTKPNTRTYNSLLNTIALSSREDAPEQATALLERMYELFNEGKMETRPDTFSYSAVLSAYLRSSFPDAAIRADELIQEMEDKYDSKELSDPPSVYHYTISCSCWSKSSSQRAAIRCREILEHMFEREKRGFTSAKPNVRTYNAIIDCYVKTRNPQKGEEFLKFMIKRFEDGEEDAKPNPYTFLSIINSYTRQTTIKAGRKAENVLASMLKFHRKYPDFQLSRKAFSHIISFYTRCENCSEAPERADVVLRYMLEYAKRGYKDLTPNFYMFESVFDSYGYNRHPYAGPRADNLLDVMKTFLDDYNITSIRVNNSLLNAVLHAWSVTEGEYARNRTFEILEQLESEYEAGDSEMQPTTRSYGLVLMAIGKSESPKKALQAERLLKKMEEQARNGNGMVQPNERAYSSVINACAFTAGDENDQKEAFRIMTETFTKLLEGKFELGPNVSRTYGWIFKGCGRLVAVPVEVREEYMKKVFRRCCKDGLVTDFVLQQFNMAAGWNLFSSETGCEKFMPKDANGVPEKNMHRTLDPEWTRNVREFPTKQKSVQPLNF